MLDHKIQKTLYGSKTYYFFHQGNSTVSNCDNKVILELRLRTFLTRRTWNVPKNIPEQKERSGEGSTDPVFIIAIRYHFQLIFMISSRYRIAISRIVIADFTYFRNGLRTGVPAFQYKYKVLAGDTLRVSARSATLRALKFFFF